MNKGSFIITATGKKFFPLDPDPAMICLEDIAHALSLKCRWGGHTKKFYSVALHSIYCAAVVKPGFNAEALMHDASEAYLVDMPAPVKLGLPEFCEAEDRLQQAIFARFKLRWPLPQEVKVADRSALWVEANAVMPAEVIEHITEVEPAVPMPQWKKILDNPIGHTEAKQWFLELAEELNLK